MILNFEDELGDRHFQFCFVGFVLGGSLQEKKGMQILRLEVALFEKLESISALKPCGKKMINYIAQVPWQTGTPSRNALNTLDWLQAASRTHG